MLRYILLQARDDDAAQRIKVRLKEYGPHSCSVWPEEIHFREDKQNHVMLLGFENRNSAGFHKRHLKDVGGGTFFFDGLPYFQGVTRETFFDDLFAHHTSKDEETFHREVFGSWSKGWLSKNGAYAISDFTGMSPLYMLSTGDFNAISNRQLLLGVARDGRSVQLDGFAASWITGQASHMSDEMIVDGVRHVHPAAAVRMSFAKHTMAMARHEILTPQSELQDDITDQESEELSASMIDQMSALSGLVDSVRLDITGGRDSRTVVALALASKMKDKIETLQTGGIEGSREIEVGVMLSDLVSIKHTAHIHGSANSILYDPKQIIERVRAQAFRYEGMICPTDAYAPGAAHSRLILSGAAGEVFRRHCKPHMAIHLETPKDVYDTYASYQQNMDPIGVQTSETSLRQQASMREAAFGFLGAGNDPNDVSDAFFMRYRLPHWNGVIFNTARSAVRVTPLANYVGYRLSFSKNYKLRIWDRYHYEILRRTNEKLVQAPLLDDPWSPHVRQIAGRNGMELTSEAFKTTERKTLQDLIPIGVMTAKDETGEFESYLRSVWPTELDRILSKDAVMSWFGTEKVAMQKGITGVKSIMSILNLAALFSSDYIHELDGNVARPADLNGEAEKLFGAPQLHYADVQEQRLKFVIS